MQVANIRFGFATNSSSVHSIILNHDLVWDHLEGQCFGWDEWSAVSEQAKRAYLAQTLYANLVGAVGEEIADSVVRDWVGVAIDKEGYVDHQSVMDLPHGFETKQVSRAFFNDLLTYYLRPHLAIVGGNDNEDFYSFPKGMRKEHIVPTDGSSDRVCRRDGDWWILFHKGTGLKLRLSFKDDAEPYTKATLPELVDVKITDFCPQACAWCYQSSGIGGAPADYSCLVSLAYDLAKLEVFEVALGGGEPTSHPQFPSILHAFRDRGIIPNFSTGSLNWMENSEILEVVRHKVGRFGISVSTASEALNAMLLMQHYGFEYYNSWILGEKATYSFHYVMGATPLKNLREILLLLNKKWIPVTLLGYKAKGRGSTFKPYDYSGWLDLIGKYDVPIGIDSALASAYKDEILARVDSRLVTFEEGQFSMYVDAVNKKMGPSSFCDDSELVDAPQLHKVDWPKVFGSF